MPKDPSPSASAHELWKISSEEALALVDEHLGPPADWNASALLSYRLGAKEQEDWKAEVGHWLHAAKSYGALQRFLAPLHGERRKKSRRETRDADDPRHLKLHQQLGAAMVCHYFTGLGWSAIGFDTDTGGPTDIDLALSAPDGNLVEFQVKVPDHPGEVAYGRYVGGNSDARVLESLDGAVSQLPPRARSVAMVAMFAQRDFALTGKPVCIERHVFGSTLTYPSAVYLPRANFGRFLTCEWSRVAGIVLLEISRSADLFSDGKEVRFIDYTRYPCTVLLNPNAAQSANADWFPRARVLVLENGAFRWIRGAPWDRTILPTGTQVIDEPPELSAD